FDTKMAIYTACPTASGQALACNDDFCGTSSQVSFPTVAATLYRIRIGSPHGETGGGTMTISCTAAPPCPADVNHSGAGNIDDLLAVINAWGACAPPCPPDINGNGVVDIDDLLAVINAWGPCP